MSFTELLGNVGLFGGAVMVCLALLSIFSVGVIVDKHRRFRLASRQSQMFKPEFRKFLHGGDVQDTDRSRAAAPEFLRGAGGLGGHPRVRRRAPERRRSGRLARTRHERTRGLHVRDADPVEEGSRVPGHDRLHGSVHRSFGTVVGIINAFRSIAATGSGGMAVVSGGIAEALVSTALGIFVAIPAVVAFNHFTGKIETFHVEMNRASSQLVNCLFKIPELDGARSQAAAGVGDRCARRRPMRLGEPGKMQAAINITPLVDVVLVLLIIFMVMAPEMRKGPDVNVPNTAKPNEQGDERGRILVSIDETGGLWINDQACRSPSISAKPSAPRWVREKDPKVVIRGDAKLNFREVRQAMIAIEQAGFRGVGLIAKRAERRRRREITSCSSTVTIPAPVCSPRSTSRRSSTWCSCC